MNDKTDLATHADLKPALIIGRERVVTEKHFDVVDPATGLPFLQCPLAGVGELDAAVDAARRAFPSWAATPIDERARQVRRIADLLEQNKVGFATLLSKEQGKPAHSGALGEIMGAIGWVRATCDLRPPVEVLKDDPTGRVELHRKPLGVVGSITPWNFPVMIAIWHIVPALVAGNTVVIKPSPNTPLTTLRLVELASALLPRGVVNAVTGDKEIGQAMARHPGIDKIIFTGSTATGRSIMADGSVNLKRLTLELGGNDAGIVLMDADIEVIAPKIFAKSFGNSGQICAALKRLYVHDHVHDALAGRLAEMARAAVVGPSDDPASQFGPLQNKRQFDYVCVLAQDAAAHGGSFLAGGKPIERPGFFFPLSVVVGVSEGVRVVDEEQFGPILPIIRYDDVEDALRQANAGESGLGGSIWSSDVTAAAALAKRLECGTAWVNDHATISPDVPFGGAKQSGLGCEFGLHGLDEYLQIQTIRINR